MWLERLKRRVYAAAFLLAAFAAAFSYILHPQSSGTGHIQLVFGPIVAVVATAMAVAVLNRRVALRPIEVGGWLIAVSLLLLRTAVAMFQEGESGMALVFAPSTPWIAAVFVLGFLMLDKRCALLGSVVLYATMILMVGTYVAMQGISSLSRFELNALVQQYVVANSFYVVLLYVMARAREEYGKADFQSRVMSKLAYTDELTGIPNRRYIAAAASKEIARIERDARPFSVITVDIDHFKRVNDTHGHMVGDAVLQSVAEVLSSGLRGGDELGRVGGEEFVVLAYDAGIVRAEALAERLREALEQHQGESTPRVTASFGVVEHQPGDTFSELVDRADHALYLAKNRGRNRVEAWEGAATEKQSGLIKSTAPERGQQIS